MNSQLLVNDDLYESESYEEGGLAISQDDVLSEENAGREQRSSFLVKILNGPHEGAEMEIPSEGIILGSGDACDLIVFDPKMAARHFRLIPHNEGVILSPIEGDVWLSGAPIQEDTVVKNATQVITAGDTYFVTGAQDQEWPEVILPTEVSSSPEHSQDLSFDPPKENKKSKKGIFVTLFLWLAVVVVGGGVGFWHLSQKNTLNEVHHPYLFSAVQKVKKASYLAKEYVSKKLHSLPSSSSLVSSTPKKTSIPKLPPSLEAKIAQELLKNVPGVVFSCNSETGKKQFDVWTRGEQSSVAVRRILSPVSPPLVYNLIDLSQVETSAMTLAQLFGISVKVHVEPEGIAFWEGYQRDEANWKVFFSHATRELPAIRDHRCQIVFGTRIASTLNKELQQQGFSTNARFVADDNGLHTEGSLPEPQKAKWDLWMAEIHKMYASQVTIVDRVNSIEVVPVQEKEEKLSLKELFPSPVVGISGTAQPWVSLADGSKFFPGAKLKKGYTLEAITNNILRINSPEGIQEFSVPSMME